MSDIRDPRRTNSVYVGSFKSCLINPRGRLCPKFLGQFRAVEIQARSLYGSEGMDKAKACLNRVKELLVSAESTIAKAPPASEEEEGNTPS